MAYPCQPLFQKRRIVVWRNILRIREIHTRHGTEEGELEEEVGHGWKSVKKKGEGKKKKEKSEA